MQKYRSMVLAAAPPIFELTLRQIRNQTKNRNKMFGPAGQVFHSILWVGMQINGRLKRIYNFINLQFCRRRIFCVKIPKQKLTRTEPFKKNIVID